MGKILLATKQACFAGPHASASRESGVQTVLSYNAIISVGRTGGHRTCTGQPGESFPPASPGRSTTGARARPRSRRVLRALAGGGLCTPGGRRAVHPGGGATARQSGRPRVHGAVLQALARLTAVRCRRCTAPTAATRGPSSGTGYGASAEG